MKKYQSIRIGITAALLAAPWVAQADEPGFYVGATAGVYNIEQDTLDDDDAGLLKAFGGFQVNPWLGFEASWLDFNRNTEQANEFESDGLSAAALVSVPIGESSSVFAKVGQYWWDVDTTIAGITVSADGDDSLWGAGFKFGFTDHLHLRLEYENYDVGDFEVEAASAGLQLTF